MKTAYTTVVSLFLIGSFVESCADRGTEPANLTAQLPTLTVEPASGKIGSIVSIRGGLFNTPGIAYTISFPGADSRLEADSSKDSTIYTFVPFGARSGPVTIYTDRVLGTTGEFRITESPDTLALTVQLYDISPPVTAKDSFVVDRMGILQSWRAVLRGDTIHVSRGFSTGEDYFEYHFVLAEGGPGTLPRVVSFWVFTKPDYPGSWIDSIHAGVLKLQKYDPNGIIAGKFFGKPSASRILNGTFAFWADIRR